MAWFFRDHRRGPEWKQGWTSQAVSSISLPPFPLIAVFAIVILFLSLSHYTDYKAHMEKNMINFQLLLFVLPVALIFVVKRNISFDHGRFSFWRRPRPAAAAHHDSVIRQHGTGDGSSPWGVALVVVLLLLMISYKSSFDSMWLRPLWRSNY